MCVLQRQQNRPLIDTQITKSCLRYVLLVRSSRKGTCDTAQHLFSTTSNRFIPGRISAYVVNANQQEQLRQASLRLIDKQLQKVVQAGIGFHNAAVEAHDRALVEQLFRNSLLMVGTDLQFHSDMLSLFGMLLSDMLLPASSFGIWPCHLS